MERKLLLNKICAMKKIYATPAISILNIGLANILAASNMLGDEALELPIDPSKILEGNIDDAV